MKIDPEYMENAATLYRGSNNRKTVIRRCKNYFNNNEKDLIPLNDNDYLQMLKWKVENKGDEIKD